MRYRFADFVFDTDRHELSAAGLTVHLPLKAFALLEALLESRPRALCKEELHERLWPSVHVSDASLARVVSELRSALDESPRDSGFIRTIHGFGYAFEGQVSDEEDNEGAHAETGHVLVWNQRHIYLRLGDNILGRDSDSILFLDAAQVSRRHCRIRVAGDCAVVEDLDSKNGTFVGGEKIDGPVELEVGDIIEVGPVKLIYGNQLDNSTVTQLTV